MKNKLYLLLGIILLSLFSVSAQTFYLNSSYPYRQEINVTGGTIDLINKTVFIPITYNSNMRNDFSGLTFVLGSCPNATQELNYELDTKINGVSAGFWVLFPTLTTGTNKVCLFYENVSGVSKSNGINAWDNYYLSVWHLNGNFNDSKNFNVTGGTAVGSPTLNNSCLFGTCYTFDGNDAISLGNTYDNMAEMTAEGFGILRDTGDYRSIISQVGSSEDRAFQLRTDTGTTDAGFYTWKSDGGGVFSVLTGSFGMNKWNYIAGTTNGLARVLVNSTIETGSAFADTTDISLNPAVIGGAYAEGNYIQFWVGEIDEVRFSTTNRSAEWLARSYNDINPSYVTLGSEEQNFVNVYPIFTSIVEPTNNTQYSALSVFSASISNSNGTQALNLNGVNYTIPYSAILPAGNYNYYFWAYGNGNPTLFNKTETKYFTIAKNSSYNLALTSASSFSLNYPTQSTITGTGCPSQLICILFRNNANVSNPDTQTLPIGNYLYTYNSSGNANYSSKSISQNLNVHEKDKGSIYNLLNGVGAGLGLFFLFIADSLPILLIGLALVGIIFVIGMALAKAIRRVLGR